MHITRVGLGTWAVGGPKWAFGWGPQSDDDSIAAIRHAIALGINWIDTAAAYGHGHSEEVIRRALQPIPMSERPYVFTKCGLSWDENDHTVPPRQVGRPEVIRREVEQSLLRLGVECIDLYQMHWPAADGTSLAEYWQTLIDLKREGKVAAVGLSNHNALQLAEAEAIGHVDTLQPPFSAIRRDMAASELPWCLEHETGVLVYSPMQSGLLSGSFDRHRAQALGVSDWRSKAPEFIGAKLQRNLELADALVPIANRHGTGVGAVAVAWTLSWPGVTSAIAGARDPAQIESWIDAGSLTLTNEDLDEIASALHRTGAGSGPMKPLSPMTLCRPAF